MKKSNLQIVLIIAIIAFLSTAFLSAVYAQEGYLKLKDSTSLFDNRIVSIKNTGLSISDNFNVKPLLVIKQSKAAYSTNYKIVDGNTSYYSNSLFVFEKQKFIEFSCSNRKGELQWYRLPFKGLKIYQSK